MQKEITTNNNPLKDYFRIVKMHIRLASAKDYYDSSIVEVNEFGEVGIFPMTGKDELILKNPSGLLNGEAIVSLLNSCVPAVKKPQELLSNDIDVLITAIRHVSFENHLDLDMECPECQHRNTFEMDLAYALENMSFLEKEYPIKLDNGLTLYIRPFRFNDLLTGLHVQFEQAKLARELSDETTTEEEKLAKFGKQYNHITDINIELIGNSIEKIYIEDKKEYITDRTFIAEFLNNCEKGTVAKIDTLLKVINKIGLKKTFTAVCEKCEHEWEADMEFNPVNFS
jgi:T4 bacteriophage base plate protein